MTVVPQAVGHTPDESSCFLERGICSLESGRINVATSRFGSLKEAFGRHSKLSSFFPPD